MLAETPKKQHRPKALLYPKVQPRNYTPNFKEWLTKQPKVPQGWEAGKLKAL